ncbi:protein of unknown function [Methylorubrum extorquens DM4]|uniref:Uncharacterized protein n=1 Tax=Methylorubrum extorquens (strain DSM 6343 / CIP 106787 / DM4) TaxID=661410 RepID=C7CGU5_METED|nr:protein of unknown function [Methylorubrum extorquens DM4]
MPLGPPSRVRPRHSVLPVQSLVSVLNPAKARIVIETLVKGGCRARLSRRHQGLRPRPLQPALRRRDDAGRNRPRRRATRRPERRRAVPPRGQAEHGTGRESGCCLRGSSWF